MKQRSVYSFLFLLLIGGILNYSSFHIIVSATLIGTSVTFLGIKYVTRKRKLILTHSSLIFVFITLFILIYHLIRIHSIYQISRILVFISILFMCLFVIPRMISQNVFLHTVALVSIPVVIFGLLPTEIVGTFEIVGNSNGRGMIAVIGAIAAYSTYMITDSDQIRLFMFIFIIINIAGVILSNSRLATGLLILGILYSMVGYIINSKIQTVIILGGFFSALLFFIIAVTQLPGSQLARSVLEWNRVEIWTSAIQAISDRPLLGYGFGKGPDALSPYFESNSSPMPSSAHNGYLTFALWTGTIGLSILTSYICIFLHTLFWNRSIDPGISALFGVFLIRMVFESNSVIGMGFFALSLQLIFGYITVQSGVSITN